MTTRLDSQHWTSVILDPSHRSAATFVTMSSPSNCRSKSRQGLTPTRLLPYWGVKGGSEATTRNNSRHRLISSASHHRRRDVPALRFGALVSHVIKCAGPDFHICRYSTSNTKPGPVVQVHIAQMEARSTSVLVEVHAPICAAASEILTPDSLRFVGYLCNRFEDRRRALLAARQSRAMEFDSGGLPHFEGVKAGGGTLREPHSRATDDPHWQCAPIPR